MWIKRRGGNVLHLNIPVRSSFAVFGKALCNMLELVCARPKQELNCCDLLSRTTELTHCTRHQSNALDSSLEDLTNGAHPRASHCCDIGRGLATPVQSQTPHLNVTPFTFSLSQISPNRLKHPLSTWGKLKCRQY